MAVNSPSRMVQKNAFRRREQIAALYGLGGAGKTQIAIQYAYKCHRNQPETAVFWIRADNRESFCEGYNEILQTCQIPGGDIEMSQERMLKLVQSWLENDRNGKWLMVIDGADKFEDFFTVGTDCPPHGEFTSRPKLGEYIPKCDHGAILVTTRDKENAIDIAGDGHIQVPSLELPASEELIYRLMSTKEPVHNSNDVRELASLLDNLPLAIVQAIAYIEKTSSSIQEYLEIYQESQVSALYLLSYPIESNSIRKRFYHSVAETWTISLDHIEKSNPRAAKVLSLMTFFDTHAVPETLLKDKNESLLNLREALGKLVAYSFISKDVENRRFDMHRLLQPVTREWLRRRSELHTWSYAALQRILDCLPNEHCPGGRNEPWKAYLPHALAVIQEELTNVKRGNRKSLGRLVTMVAEGSLEQRDFALAESLYGRYALYCERAWGNEHEQTLQCISSLCRVRRFGGMRV